MSPRNPDPTRTDRRTATRTGRRAGTRIALTLSAGLLAGPLAVALADAAPAHAALPMLALVTTTNDDLSAGSLRSAIHAANTTGGGWTIRLQAGQTYVVNRQCGLGDLDDNHGGDLDITSDANIRIEAVPVGDVPGTATIQVQCAGERVIDHLGTGVLLLDHVTITGGSTARGANGVQSGNRDAGNAASGGGIHSLGTVELHDSAVIGNATGDGGSGAPPLFSGSGGRGGTGGNGGGIFAVAVHAYDSVIADNVAGNGGRGGNGFGPGASGGDGGAAGGGGGIVALEVQLVNTEVRGNRTGHGGNGGQGIDPGDPGGRGGDGGRGAGVVAATATIDASTFVANQAGDGGDGGAGDGAPGGDGGDGGYAGGLLTSSATIDRTTVVSNGAGVHGHPGTGAPAGTRGDLGYGGGIVATTQAEIQFTTVVRNTAEDAANLSAPAVSTLTASIVGLPLGGGASCSAVLTSGGSNATDDTSCSTSAADRVVSPLPVGEAGDHGGPTTTVLPLGGSALHGMIEVATCTTLLGADTTDQRGEPRPAGACEPGAVELAIAGASVYTPLDPTRLFDTRESGPAGGFVGAGQTRTVRFAGMAGIPASGVTAVAFNLTLDATAGAGYVTVSPTGTPRPLTSSVNASSAGQTVPNLVVVPLGTDGSLDFYSQSGTHLIADVVGYFTPSAAGARAGRIVTVPPIRAFDTRTAPGGRVPAGGTMSAKVTNLAGVPPTGVSAVVINLTGVESDAAGYVTMWAGGQPKPWAASLNFTRSNQVTGNMTIMPVGADGTIQIYSQSGADFVGDVTGYITDDTAAYTTDGLFVPVTPGRWFDTREAAPLPGALLPGQTRTATLPGGGVPAGAGAVVMNLTGVDPVEPGYVTGWPAGAPMPLASSLNLDDGGLRGNAAILATGPGGAISFLSNMGTDLVADAYGYVLGDPYVFTEM